jgi:hypothetical protein
MWALLRKVRNLTRGLSICKTARKTGRRWLAFAAIRLFEAIVAPR